MTKLEIEQTDANELAKMACVDPKAFRRSLRAANFPWHRHGEKWIVQKDSMEHGDMERVLDSALRGDVKS